MSGTVRADRAVDYLELQIRITLKQADLEIHCLRGVEEEHGVPFDVEDTVRRSSLDRGEDTAPVCPRGATGVGCKGH